jgi:MFS family permease
LYSLLLLIIYLTFINLGLPDGLLGAAWPAMRAGLGAPVHYAGILSMVAASGTIISSLLSDRLTRRFGTGPVVVVSVCMTAAALFGYSVSDSFLPLCLWSAPYGLGAGAVDAAVNNYVAVHYSSKHINWLH